MQTTTEKKPRRGRRAKDEPKAAEAPVLAAPNVEHAEVYPNPNQPRKEFDLAHITELARSIFQVGGLIQAVKLTPRPHPTNRALTKMIVAGECRWRAFGLLLDTIDSADPARLAALDVSCDVEWWPKDEAKDDATLLRVARARFSKMAADVKVMTDSEIEDAAIIENLVRRNISPLEEARAFQRRLDNLAREYPDDTPERLVERLASRLGLKQAWRITERTAILRLSAELQDAFAKSMINPSQATEMAKLKPAHQRVLFEAIREGRCKTYAELRRTVQMLLDADAQPVAMFLEVQSPAAAGGAAPTAPPSGNIVFQVHQSNTPTAAAADAARPVVAVTSAEDRARATALEAKIDAVVELLKAGFDGNDVIVLRRVSRTNADVTAEKLAIIQAQLKKLELSLRAAAVVERAKQEDARAAAPVESEAIAA